jgi:hypothetical protein
MRRPSTAGGRRGTDLTTSKRLNSVIATLTSDCLILQFFCSDIDDEGPCKCKILP